MDIAIYGGSFNPPHLGHREAVITALEALLTTALVFFLMYRVLHLSLAFSVVLAAVLRV